MAPSTCRQFSDASAPASAASALAATVVHAGRTPALLDHRGRRLARHIDVGEPVLHGLERADGLAELLAHLRVVRRHREHGVGRAEQLVREGAPAGQPHR